MTILTNVFLKIQNVEKKLEISQTLISAIYWIHYWTSEVKVFRGNFTTSPLLM